MEFNRRNLMTSALALGRDARLSRPEPCPGTAAGVRNLHRQLGGGAQGRAGAGLPQGQQQRRDYARPDAVGRSDRQGQGGARQPADRRDAARSGSGAGRDRPGPGRAVPGGVVRALQGSDRRRAGPEWVRRRSSRWSASPTTPRRSRRRRPRGPTSGSPSSRAGSASPTSTRRSAPAGWSRSPACAAAARPMSMPASRRSRN